MQRSIYLFVALCCFSLIAEAQKFNVSGVAKDDAGVVVPIAAIALLHAADSSFVQAETTGDDGKFNFKDVEQGKYIVAIQAAGYVKTKQQIDVNSNMSALVVAIAKDNRLQEVTVSDKKPYIETGLGKTTVNVDQAATSAGSNVLELLRKSPGVVVDGNGNVSLKGNGVLILVDDKQTHLSADQLADYLKSLPAEQVAQLELISQPSSKYDAEGAGGIINIKLKKMKKRGLNGSLTSSYGQGKYPSTHNNFNLNYRTDKVNLYTGLGYLHATGFMNQDTKRDYTNPSTGMLTTHYDQVSFMKETFEDYSMKLGSDYTVNDKLTVGVSADGVYHPNHENDVTRSVITDKINNVVSYNNTTNKRGFLRKNIAANGFAKYIPAKDQQIDINADYVKHTSNNSQDVTAQNYDQQFVPIPGDVLLRSEQPSHIESFVANADYTGTLSKKVQMEAGLKTSFTTTDDDNQFYDLQTGIPVFDTVHSSHFVYKENINAAYANLNKKFSEKVQAQVGFRVENANISGHQYVQNQSFERSTTNVFPTGYISYKADDKNEFQLNYGRRIIRPSYRELDPFITFISQYSYSGGNPNLLPAFRNYIEFSHNYNNMLYSSAGFRKISNTVNPVNVYNAVTKAVYGTEENYADRYVLQLSTNFNKQLFAWWMMSSSIDLYVNQYTIHKGNARLANSVGADAGMQNQFTFNGWTIDTTVYVATGGLQNLTERNGSSIYIGCGIAKKILKDSATIKLSAEDPFDMYRYTLTKDWQGIHSHSVMGYATQNFSLGFTYNFGKKFESRQHEHNTEEAGRM
ncbi:MAG: hypothetical protein BGO70_02545 [Bacteroidetes bacterium 43-93]|nr:TonB-dependent receptor [Bacteroidota bacterium]OJW99174.1 MAG: hypothetical protein BGO70_02545 [Bacteroidetes bacterium 43-93]